MREAKRCGCSFQQSGYAVAGERIRVNAASNCGRNSYTCQNRCQPKPCTPRPCERVCRPKPCTPHCSCSGDDFESSYRSAMNNPYRNDRNVCDCFDDCDGWCDDFGDNWYCDDYRDGNCCGNRRRRYNDCGCGCRRRNIKDDCASCNHR